MDSDTRDLLDDAKDEIKAAKKVSHVVNRIERALQLQRIDVAIELLWKARQAIIDSKPHPSQFAGIADCGSDL